MSGGEWTHIVSAVTLLVGLVACTTSGFMYQRRDVRRVRRWPVEIKVVRALALFMMGLMVLHIAVSRIYEADAVYHLFDLNSPWTAALRSLTFLALVWLFIRVDDE